MYHKAPMLLIDRFADLCCQLCSITTHWRSALNCLLITLLSCLVVFLHQQIECLVSVEEHLILFNIDILWRNGVFTKISSYKNTEAIFADNIFIKVLHELRCRQSRCRSTFAFFKLLFLGCWLSCSGLAIFCLLILDLFLLGDNVFEILELNLKKVNDRLSRLWLT